MKKGFLAVLAVAVCLCFAAPAAAQEFHPGYGYENNYNGYYCEGAMVQGQIAVVGASMNYTGELGNLGVSVGYFAAQGQAMRGTAGSQNQSQTIMGNGVTIIQNQSQNSFKPYQSCERYLD